MTSEHSRAAQPAPAPPRCYRHPNRETWVSCTRCERPICPDCLRPAAVGFQCPQCVAEGQATSRQPHTRYGARIVQRPGLVTVVLGTLSVIVYLATALTSPAGFSQNTASELFAKLDLVPTEVANQGEYWRLISSAFLHVGLLHLIVNMIALAIVGPSLERVFGHWRFLALYLLAAFGGSVSVYLFDDQLRAVAGASGAIYGLFAATVVVLRNLGLDPRAMIITIAINFAISFAPGISLLGHLGGFIIGGVVALALVYAPRGRNRTLVQVLALGAVLVILLALAAYRTGVLTS
jgi:membrane associated rhomboid family serine protease